MVNDMGAAIASAAQTVGPLVVGVGRGWARGSGVVIRPGKLLVSAHTVRGPEVEVTLHTGAATPAEVLGVDLDANLAVLQVAEDAAPAAVEWQPDAAAEAGIGTPVVALANPAGRGLRATAGFICASGLSFRGPRGRTVGSGIEHTAPLPRGSSGGPLVLADGRLVGVNALRVEGGLILALAADADLAARVDGLLSGESQPRARLGLAIASPHAARRMRRAVGLPDRDGLLVRSVSEGGPAAGAGIARGDLLVAANGTPLASMEDLLQVVDGLVPSGTAGAAAKGKGVKKVRLDVVRGVDEVQVSVAPELAAPEGPR
jgi:serine protease Do